MAQPRIGSPGVGLPIGGQNSATVGQLISLAAGQKWIIPAGEYYIKLGPYTNIEFLDPVSGIWNLYGIQEDGNVDSDGVNFRIANRTGCAVGALVTTAGTGYLTVPTVTASSGSSTWRAVLGGQISATVTVATAGVGYNRVPTVLLPPPPNGGITATAVAVISGGTISSVTVTNQGSGYTTAPSAASTNPTAAGTALFGPQANTYQIIPDPSDTITTQAALTFGLTANTATNVTSILCTDPGTALTSVPTLTIAAAPGGGTTAIATAIMQFTVTGWSTGANVGSGYGNTQPVIAFAPGFTVAGTQANTNPVVGTGLFTTRAFQAYGTSANNGILATTALNFTIADGGLHQGVPTALAFLPAGTFVPTLNAAATATVGGVTDTFYIQQY